MCALRYSNARPAVARPTGAAHDKTHKSDARTRFSDTENTGGGGRGRGPGCDAGVQTVRDFNPLTLESGRRTDARVIMTPASVTRMHAQDTHTHSGTCRSNNTHAMMRTLKNHPLCTPADGCVCLCVCGDGHAQTMLKSDKCPVCFSGGRLLLYRTMHVRTNGSAYETERAAPN